jgi:hypothetical protein
VEAEIKAAKLQAAGRRQKYLLSATQIKKGAVLRQSFLKMVNSRWSFFNEYIQDGRFFFFSRWSFYFFKSKMAVKF